MEIKFHNKGFQELLTGASTKTLVKGHADNMADRANTVPSTTQPANTEPYYEVEDGTTDRARYRVHTHGARAAKHEAKTQALQKGI